MYKVIANLVNARLVSVDFSQILDIWSFRAPAHIALTPTFDFTAHITLELLWAVLFASDAFLLAWFAPVFKLATACVRCCSCCGGRGAAKDSTLALGGPVEVSVDVANPMHKTTAGAATSVELASMGLEKVAKPLDAAIAKKQAAAARGAAADRERKGADAGAAGAGAGAGAAGAHAAH